MNIVSRKNFLIMLSAILVVALGFMALSFTINPKTQKLQTVTENEFQQIETQSESDEIIDIEHDLNTTTFDNIDEELQYIEKELNTNTY